MLYRLALHVQSLFTAVACLGARPSGLAGGDSAVDLANKVLKWLIRRAPTVLPTTTWDGDLKDHELHVRAWTDTFMNRYTYEAASNRTSLTAPDGSISTYGYDTRNRLNGLANSWVRSFGYSYDVLSRRTQLTRPNGVNTNYSYDSLSHLLSVLHQAGVNTLDGARYTYDPAGNRTAKTNYLNGITSNYSYDPLYELMQGTQGASTPQTTGHLQRRFFLKVHTPTCAILVR